MALPKHLKPVKDRMLAQADRLIERHLATLETGAAEDTNKPQAISIGYKLHMTGPEDDRILQIDATAKVGSASAADPIRVIMDGKQLQLL